MKVNDTLIKFGYPKSLIKEYQHWCVLLRYEQTTLGSLLLICKDDVNKFSNISKSAFDEYGKVITDIENNLNDLFEYDKINYLMLMMVDPNVHFHVIPRYSEDKNYLGKKFIDRDWPGKPNLENKNILDKKLRDKLKKNLEEKFCISRKKYKIVYTTGAFDYFHHGHLNILTKSKELCDYLIVGVSTDELIKKEKGQYPIVTLKDRIKIVSAIECVDEVIPQKSKNKQQIVDKYNINAITVGDDWKNKYPSVSCEIIYLPYTKNISSTKIKENNSK
tara:strand:- start:132 stop:959 length:828 start_codon:yes stop_codon:yes gene_type:complete